MAELQEALTGRPTPASRPTAPTRAPAPVAPQPPPAPTTFTQAAHAVEPRTDVVRRGGGRRLAPVLALGALAAGLGLWAARGRLMPAAPDKPAEPVAAAAQPPIATPPPQAPPEAPAKVTAALATTPTGARVVRESDGATLGMTPYRGNWPASEGILKLRIELDGYQPKPVVVPLDRGVDLQFALAKLSSPPEPRKSRGQAKDAHAAAARRRHDPQRRRRPRPPSPEGSRPSDIPFAAGCTRIAAC